MVILSLLKRICVICKHRGVQLVYCGQRGKGDSKRFKKIYNKGIGGESNLKGGHFLI